MSSAPVIDPPIRETILIKPDGMIVFVWSDDLAPLTGEGATLIRRVSHVEPFNTLEPTVPGWWASLWPVNGPDFGPFPLRAQALEAERAWLTEHLAEVA